ncbi:hypothetical protein ACFV24_08690 [Nocardia fluminea]
MKNEQHAIPGGRASGGLAELGQAQRDDGARRHARGRPPALSVGVRRIAW